MYCTTREEQCIQYFKFIFLEIQNVRIRPVFPDLVTCVACRSMYSYPTGYVHFE